MKKTLYLFLSLLTLALSTQANPTAINPMDTKIFNRIGVDAIRDLVLDHRNKFASTDIPIEKRGRDPIHHAESPLEIGKSWGHSVTVERLVILRDKLDVKDIYIFNDLASPNSTVMLTDSEGRTTLIHVNEPNTVTIPSLQRSIQAGVTAKTQASEQQTKSLMEKAGDFLGYKSSSKNCSLNKGVRFCNCKIPQTSTAHPAVVESQCLDEKSTCLCTTMPGPKAAKNTFSHFLVSQCGGEQITTPIIGQIFGTEKLNKIEH